MQLSDILTPEELSSVPENVAVKIESAYKKSLNEYEAAGDKKFNTLVEAVSKQFDQVVNNAAKEKVDSMKQNVMAEKLYECVEKIVNVLNEAQIETNQVRDAKREAAAAKDALAQKVIDYKIAQKKLMYATIAERVLRETNGYKPEIQQMAVEHFTNPKMNINADDLKKEDIINFINGVDDDRMTSSEFSGIGEIKSPDQLGLDELNDVANNLMNDDIAQNGLSKYNQDKMKVNEVRYQPSEKFMALNNKKPVPKVNEDGINSNRRALAASVGFGSKKAEFESLGKGLSENKVFGNSPNVTPEMLSENASLSGNIDAEDDVLEAINMLNDFSSFS